MKSSAFMLNTLSNNCNWPDVPSNRNDAKKEESPSFGNVLHRVKPLRKLTMKLGVYTPTHLFAGGFEYTGNGDTARCKECGLEISSWTVEMNPFDIHSKQKPDCPFVRSITVSSLSNLHASSSSLTIDRRVETIDSEQLSNTFRDVDVLQQIRPRTFSHWPQRTIPSTAQMIEAGFFYCNVGDRVVCIYCNLICQQWTPHTDDPCEVHKTLSPNCIYVKAKLIRPSVSSMIIINENSTSAAAHNPSPTLANLDSLRSNEIVFKVPCNPDFAALQARYASFATWPQNNLPPVDDLVRAGFFYTGRKTIVTCFYCNGSLQNWGPNDNPMIEHARWFLNCGYAKQLCDDDLYRKIRESIRAQQERARAKEAKEKAGSGVMFDNDPSIHSEQLLVADESTLYRLVAARLDLTISQRLLDQNFKLSIIKRCWKDQLRLKQDDFVSECDLYVACLILQKQIEYIDGKKENIVIPSLRMKQIKEQNEAHMREQTSNLTHSTAETLMNTSSDSLIDEYMSCQSSFDSTSESTTSDDEDETEANEQTALTSYDQDRSAHSASSNQAGGYM